MPQYEPTCIPFAVAVGTDSDGNNRFMPLTWGFGDLVRRNWTVGPQSLTTATAGPGRLCGFLILKTVVARATVGSNPTPTALLNGP
ncbi:hypothetical protein GCM10014715_33140 [Streptomyces spiralis]|uniref:Uncharacterized protein n=1 Tax=Streptomyces spiralis TaxID=66376 RepID=A0A918ZX40_9ACTN|nr:hypothetical protein GCM10014715_33140 [Streptomyces spiralis]